MRWIRSHTDIPVPEVFAFDVSSENEMGFEWTIMELMPGATADSRWRRMSDAQKTALVHRMAEFQAQLLKQCLASDAFRGIGTLDPCRRDAGGDGLAIPGQMVSMFFCWGDRFDSDVAKGPFRSSHDWLEAQLSMVKRDQIAASQRAEDEDDQTSC